MEGFIIIMFLLSRLVLSGFVCQASGLLVNVDPLQTVLQKLERFETDHAKQKQQYEMLKQKVYSQDDQIVLLLQNDAFQKQQIEVLQRAYMLQKMQTDLLRQTNRAKNQRVSILDATVSKLRETIPKGEYPNNDAITSSPPNGRANDKINASSRREDHRSGVEVAELLVNDRYEIRNQGIYFECMLHVRPVVLLVVCFSICVCLCHGHFVMVLVKLPFCIVNNSFFF